LIVDRFFVIHYNELGLKKGNRDYFENHLCTNINTVLEGCGVEKARRITGRILLPLRKDADLAEIKTRLARVFGIAYFAEAWASPQALEEMEKNAWSLIEGRRFDSFRIDARRSDKRFPHTSVEINQRVGAYVKERTAARVDLENAELTCWIEVVETYALMYVERSPGPGGLPVGTSGKVVVLLSGGIDSPVAAWKMIKRGCTAIFVHFHSFPYTNKESQEKAKQIAKLLSHYQLRSKIYLVPFADIQRHIMVDTPLETRVILYRRYMMRLAEQIARREKARVLVTGDSVGQVASQTIENIDVISRAVPMPILRPLVGDDKIEIVEIARRIGTYDISILPDQDCCSLFVPKHPETKANLIEVEKSEARLEVSEAMKAALEAVEVLVEFPTVREERPVSPTLKTAWGDRPIAVKEAGEAGVPTTGGPVGPTLKK
jgi:thiamine biosynthesis protein ThiI